MQMEPISKITNEKKDKALLWTVEKFKFSEFLLDDKNASYLSF